MHDVHLIDELLRCPLCAEPLSLAHRGARCPQGHAFDRARQGYFNLLPVHQRASKSPGDDRDMVRARRLVLSRRHYAPLSELINQRCAELFTHQATNIRILDVGCGEGYYSTELLSTLGEKSRGAALLGLDISKAAVRAAAVRARAQRWVVASGARIPLKDGGIDLLLCLFSPLPSREFWRVLRSNGYLLVASTGAAHLRSLRALIYEELKERSFNPELSLNDDFELLWEEQLTFPISLQSQEEVSALLAMTPHQWRASAEARARVAAQESLETMAEVSLWLFQRRSRVIEHVC